MSESLYGSKRPTKIKGKEISSSNSLAFTSSLASLISSSSSKAPAPNKPKSSKGKNDLFTAHNKNVKKRAAKDLEDENGQTHKTRDDIGSVSTAEIHRSKRRMEEKVRLYNAMKRGEYVNRSDGFDDRGLVDFDRKWAEKQVDKDDSDQDEFSDEDDDVPDEEIEYLDEFGRLRKGSKKEAGKEERRSRIEAIAREDAANFAAHPQAPTNIIYGDAIQHQAFNPEQTIAEQMAELAKKRDKSATPPPDTHFDATAEVRTKGTAFYNFSHDAEERRKEMEALEQTRLETERIRRGKEQDQRQQPQNAGDKSPANRTADIAAKAAAEKFLDEFQLPEG
ncbi:hypothetical protein PMZ80_007635 [Knufia obscura]|uniref:Uncharacterized protein n=2 Tax=Knufia TaxID=430999 RepID=A0AAN8EHH1_9EURO|nr:hypothetical protein PMZ80_007635 [Knufia obscura]KAK5954175.1 hypothetical protein OHC33_004748 [Knufia fluminis]